ncbi:hypothetical protein BC939DRAFT_438359 [Gamsiella multidivaricata]|uniref:uncharacterized protein n=1 Tax=Gamsiella multidivaricata TaxID=101098 RepID=UPI002220F177|nr:uncharacterized protein BC939DRAFT_438359 [Gamsiella multidivaricata]KAI7830572.1 hypothetical protein BC939DRAFT_438359 [Gamsiella multidivaricata]
MDEEMTITSVYNENQSKTAAARIVIPRVLGSTDVSASEPTNTLARIHKDDQALPLICVDDTNDSISSTSMSTTKAALSLQEALLMTSTSTSTTASSPLCPKRKVGQDEKPVDQIMCSTSTASHSRQPLSGQPTRQTLQGLPTHRNQTPVWSSHPYKQASGHIRHEWPKDKAHESPIRSNIGTTAPKNMRGSMESRKRTLRRL